MSFEEYWLWARHDTISRVTCWHGTNAMLLAIGHCSALHHQDRPPMCADGWTDGLMVSPASFLAKTGSTPGFDCSLPLRDTTTTTERRTSESKRGCVLVVGHTAPVTEDRDDLCDTRLYPTSWNHGNLGSSCT